MQINRINTAEYFISKINLCVFVKKLRPLCLNKSLLS